MGAPQARLSELGEKLIDLDWDVEALTALPNYPTGKIFSGYRCWRTRTETVGRIRTARVPLYPAKRGFIRRLISYFSFSASAALNGKRLLRRPDVMLVESPPLFIGYAARFLAWRWKCPYVFNVSDLYPETAVRMGMLKEGMALRMAERLERSLYEHATGVTGQSDEIVAGVRKQAPDKRTAVITNGVDLSRFGKNKADDYSRELLGNEPGPVFVYAGLMGLAQGLDQLFDLALSLPEDVPGRIVLVGEGPAREKLRARLESTPNPRIRILDALPYDRIPALLASADAAIISLGMSIPGAVPSKIYEAMASGLPILLLAEGEPARRVEAAACGISVKPGDPQAALDAYQRLATDAELRQKLGEAGRQTAVSQYDRRLIASHLDKFLRTCVDDGVHSNARD